MSHHPYPYAIEDPTTGSEIAWVAGAHQDAVDFVFGQGEGDDGHSDWVWLRLPNGDLMLGVWPSGYTYESIEGMVERDFREEDRP